MKNIKEVMTDNISGYTGSKKTYDMVAKQIKERWGEKELENYDPEQCLTFSKWLSIGFRVRKHERALKSITYIPIKDADGKVIKKIQRPVFLFYRKQVQTMVRKT